MANMSTLFRKGYLLAGVLMAANMFAVNEVKASAGNTNTTQEVEGMGDQSQNSDKIIKEKDMNDFTIKEKVDPKKQSPLDKLLSLENYFNLIGGATFSVANNYLKLWDYNPGGYCTLRIGCLGWRSKKLFDIVQIDINLNLVRGILWLIPGVFGFMQYREEKIERPIILNSTAGLITMKILYTNEDDFKKNNSGFGFGVSYFIFVILQGFISAPLTFHISNFSISISLDSILWAGIGYFLDNGKKKEANKDEEEKLFDISQSQQDLNAKNDNYNN